MDGYDLLVLVVVVLLLGCDVVVLLLCSDLLWQGLTTTFLAIRDFLLEYHLIKIIRRL